MTAMTVTAGRYSARTLYLRDTEASCSTVMLVLSTQVAAVTRHDITRTRWRRSRY